MLIVNTVSLHARKFHSKAKNGCANAEKHLGSVQWAWYFHFKSVSSLLKRLKPISRLIV